MDDAEYLLARARRGDENAFRLLFERHARPIMGFVYNLVGDRAQAEELTQETFVRAYEQMDRLRDDARLVPWLFGIARNVVREARRAVRREGQRIELDADDAPEPPDEAPLPDARLWNKELRQAVTKAIASLSEERRLVFTLKVLHLHSYEEIAEITGHSVDKLKTDVHRARAQMRRRLRHYIGENR